MPLMPPITHTRIVGTGQGWLAGRTPGLTTVDGSPAAVPIVLIDNLSGKIYMRVASRAAGEYEFRYLDQRPGRWLLIARDRSRTHNAAVADHLTAAPMSA